MAHYEITGKWTINEFITGDSEQLDARYRWPRALGLPPPTLGLNASWNAALGSSLTAGDTILLDIDNPGLGLYVFRHVDMRLTVTSPVGALPRDEPTDYWHALIHYHSLENARHTFPATPYVGYSYVASNTWGKINSFVPPSSPSSQPPITMRGNALNPAMQITAALPSDAGHRSRASLRWLALCCAQARRATHARALSLTVELHQPQTGVSHGFTHRRAVMLWYPEQLLFVIVDPPNLPRVLTPQLGDSAQDPDQPILDALARTQPARTLDRVWWCPPRGFLLYRLRGFEHVGELDQAFDPLPPLGSDP